MTDHDGDQTTFQIEPSGQQALPVRFYSTNFAKIPKKGGGVKFPQKPRKIINRPIFTK